MNKIIILIIAIALIGAGAAVVYSLNSSDTDMADMEMTPGANMSETSTQLDQPAEMVDATYDIAMDNYSFSMDEITASPGDTITINLDTTNGSHDFVIDELAVQSDVLASGETQTLSFIIPDDATGSYVYYCSLGNHRALGMEGTLVIE